MIDKSTVAESVLVQDEDERERGQHRSRRILESFLAEEIFFAFLAASCGVSPDNFVGRYPGSRADGRLGVQAASEPPVDLGSLFNDDVLDRSERAFRVLSPGRCT